MTTDVLHDLHAWTETFNQWRTTRIIAQEGAARAIAAFQTDQARDAILISLIPGHEEAGTALALDAQAAGVREALAAILQEGLAPNGNALAALELIRLLALAAPSGEVAQVASVGAVLAWWAGETDTLEELVAAALPDSPKHRLTSLIMTSQLVNLRPAWLTAAEAQLAS